MSEVTWVDKDICVCDNCGAFSKEEKPLYIIKLANQEKQKKWEKYYSDIDDKEKEK